MKELMMLLGIALLLALSACAQGFEFKIGVGQYNGASETRTYTPEKK